MIKTGNCRLVYKPAKKDGEEPSAETRCVLKGACAEIVSDVEPAPAGFFYWGDVALADFDLGA